MSYTMGPPTHVPMGPPGTMFRSPNRRPRPAVPCEHIKFDGKWANKKGSGGLAPSKSTIYISNLPFSLTNNDLHKILEKFGRCIKVSIPRDEKHRSKGVAFALFLEREPCIRVINAFNGKQLFGRTLKCSIAKDNGRAREFIRRQEYPEKSRCYECGEFGHLSYKCTRNVLGERKRPRKKKKKRKEKEEVDDYYNPDISLAEAIEEDAAAEQLYNESQESASDEPQVPDPYQSLIQSKNNTNISGNMLEPNSTSVNNKPMDSSEAERPKKKWKSNKCYKTDSYFSDEEILDET